MASIGKTIIFEIGSSSCKVGFSGEKNPRIIFPNIVAIPKTHKELKVLVGNETVENSAMVHYYVAFPIEYGLISLHSYNGKTLINYIIDYAFKEIDADPTEHPLLIPDSPCINSYECWKVRNDLSKILFEEYNVPYIYFGNQSNFALLNAGIDTGVVLDCGHNKTSCIPIYEGYPIYKNSVRIEHAGKEITEYLQKKIGAELDNDDFVIRKRFRFFDNIKKQKCHVSLDFNSEIENYDSSKDITINYENTSITLKEEQFKCAEILFDPNEKLVKESISEMIYNLINSTYDQIQKQLAENIYLTGGSTQMKNFIQRVQKDLDNMNSDYKFNVQMLPDPELGSWRGASKFGMIRNFKEIAISKQEYELKNEAIIYKKCF